MWSHSPFFPNPESSPRSTLQRDSTALFGLTSVAVILRWPGSRGSLELVGGRNATWVVWEMICNNDNSTILSHQTSTIASSSLPYLALQLTKPENSMMRCPESALPYQPATGLASSANKKAPGCVPRTDHQALLPTLRALRIDHQASLCALRLWDDW